MTKNKKGILIPNNCMDCKALDKVMDNLIDTYFKGSAISKIYYSVKKNKWTVKFSYDVPSNTFDSFGEMMSWIHDDQFTD